MYDTTIKRNKLSPSRYHLLALIDTPLDEIGKKTKEVAYIYDNVNNEVFKVYVELK